jgi:hypothetical protein
MSPKNPQPVVPDQSDPFTEPRCVPGAWDHEALQAADDRQRDGAPPPTPPIPAQQPAQPRHEAGEWRESPYSTPPITVWANMD